MSFNSRARIVGFVGMLVSAMATHAWAKGEWFQNWEMEDRVAQSQLILVARVSNVSAVTIVHGGKASATYREYRFQPVRRLKGVFSRDELAMTSTDLGLPEGDGSTVPPLQQGEFRLLLLARTAEGFSCVAGPRGAQSPDQQVPKLSGPGDPMVAMTETLVQVTELPSRKGRAELLIARLREVSGPAAVPLVMSLARRAVWAAQLPEAAGPLGRLAGDKSPAVRAAALQTIDRILAVEYLHEDSDMLGEYAEALRQAAAPERKETAARVAALRGIGRLGEFGRRLPWTAPLLVRQLEAAPTYAERGAAAAALADLNDPKAAAPVLRALEQLPLDEQPQREQALADAAARLAGRDALPVLARRIAQTVAADQSTLVEVAQLGNLRSRDAMPALLQAAGAGGPEPIGGAAEEADEFAGGGYRSFGELAIQEQMALALAFEQIKDERAVPVLAVWLRSPYVQLRERALAALDAVDTESAVAAVRLRLKPEPYLPLKLHMAWMLGRHGINDGYPFAIEHIADPGLTEFAARALAAIQSDQTRGELWRILETSHDRQWNAAALYGLAAVRDAKVKPKLLEILGNPRDPLLASAATAAGELGDRDLLPLLGPLVGSRNAHVAATALRAIGKLAPGDKPADGEESAKVLRDVATAVLAVLNDPDAGPELRLAAFETLRTMKDDRFVEALRMLADQAELENAPLLQRVEEELARARVNLSA